MRRRAIFAVISVAVAALGVGSIGVFGASAQVEFPRICHRTGSDSNPYVNNQPNNQGQFEGHADHTGPVWQPGATEWGDIIPPIPALNFPGLNWDTEGMAVWNNNCVPPNLPPPTTGAAPGTEAAPSPGPPAAAAVTGAPRFTG